MSVDPPAGESAVGCKFSEVGGHCETFDSREAAGMGLSLAGLAGRATTAAERVGFSMGESGLGRNWEAECLSVYGACRPPGLLAAGCRRRHQGKKFLPHRPGPVLRRSAFRLFWLGSWLALVRGRLPLVIWHDGIMFAGRLIWFSSFRHHARLARRLGLDRCKAGCGRDGMPVSNVPNSPNPRPPLLAPG